MVYGRKTGERQGCSQGDQKDSTSAVIHVRRYQLRAGIFLPFVKRRKVPDILLATTIYLFLFTETFMSQIFM